MIQWYFRFKAGNFENGYFEVGSNKEVIQYRRLINVVHRQTIKQFIR